MQINKLYKISILLQIIASMLAIIYWVVSILWRIEILPSDLILYFAKYAVELNSISILPLF